MNNENENIGGPDQASPTGGNLALSLLRLARPKQWSKSVFVLIGPVYGLADGTLLKGDLGFWLWPVLAAAVAFALTSSGLYVFNDLADVEADRAHPRKCRRPIASGAVGRGTAKIFGAMLLVVGLGLTLFITGPGRWWVLALVFSHAVNVSVYTAALKHRRIVDVMSLSMGFVLRVVGGCAAASIEPSTWLLNATFFLSMFLAFGKRLGERRSMGEQAAAQTRAVQLRYSLDLLRMLVVVTAVATLLTYAQYVQDRGDAFHSDLVAVESVTGFGINLLWLTMIPATFALLRAMVMVETGKFDDPTELATNDPPFMCAAGAFVVLTLLISI